MHPATLEQALAEVASLREELAKARACEACRAAASSGASATASAVPAAAPSPPPPRTTAPEILSHCSDVSASARGSGSSASGGRDRAGPASASASASTPPTGPAARRAPTGVRKPGKPRKDRAAPVPKPPGQSRYWTPDEHKLFLEALNRFGHKDLRAISAYVGTRNMTQVRTHSQKYFMRLMREAKRQNPLDAPTPPASSSGASTSFEAVSPSTAAATPPSAPPAPAPPPPSSPPADAPSPASTCVAPDAEGTDSAAAPPTPGAMSPALPEDPPSKNVDNDKYSVPNTCGMMLLCLVGQDTLTT